MGMCTLKPARVAATRTCGKKIEKVRSNGGSGVANKQVQPDLPIRGRLAAAKTVSLLLPLMPRYSTRDQLSVNT